MDFAEVVIHEMQRDGMRVHLDFLAEGIGEPSETAHVHTHRQVLALNMTGGDMPLVGIAGNSRGLHAGDLGRGVAVRGAWAGDVRPVVLLQHGVIHVHAERIIDGIQIDLVAVGGQLDAVGQPRRHILHEVVGVVGCPVANPVADDQLGVGIDGRPRPDVAPLSAFVLRDVLGLRTDEAPNFIALNPLALEASYVGVMVGRAGRSEVAEQLFDGHPSHADQAGGTPQAVAFHQGGHDGCAFLHAQLIHG